MSIQDQLDKLASDYNKTKDPKLRDLWYKKIKELAHGSGYYNTKGRTVPFDPNSREHNN
tara:strand:- start:332 stop:508 length:177 start_codon:yes stop_codon:yes gene_type:complete